MNSHGRRFLDSAVTKSDTSGAVRVFERAHVAALLVLALLLRLALYDYVSSDALNYILPSLQTMREQGALASFAARFNDYPPAFLYVLALFSYIPKSVVRPLFLVKTFSVAFDAVLALGMYRIVRLRHPQGELPLLACFAVLFMPTVVLNGALWAQRDAVYASFLLWCVLFLCRGEGRRAWSAFALSLCFKLQALFLLPLIWILLVAGALPWSGALLAPLFYIAVAAPAWMLGAPWGETIAVYRGQIEKYRDLNMLAPNIYQWLPEEHYSLFLPAGICLAAAALLLLSWCVLRRRRSLSRDQIVKLALISTVMMPYLLPKMHERYFFPADIFALVYAFYFPRYFYVPIAVVFASLCGYLRFLFTFTLVPLPLVALLVGAVVIVVLGDLLVEIYSAEDDGAGVLPDGLSET